MLKRIFDIIAAAVGLALLVPIKAIVAVAVWYSSPGPVLFRQERVGRNGRTFVLLKFRTMREQETINREKVNNRRTEARGQEFEVTTSGGVFEPGHSARVTSVGRFLRTWKLDELPQLWNVLRGDMSLVGPRPEVRKWVEAYPERWANVLMVRPGITDPASITYRNEEDILAKSFDPEKTYREEIMPHKLDLYEEYVRTQSFWGDVLILFKTVWAVIRKQET